MRLAIIEPAYHAEVLNNLCLLLQGSSIEVTIVTQEEIHNQLDFEAIEREQFKWLINPKGQSFKKFFKKHFQEIDSNDIVLLNTVATHHKLFSGTKFSGKSILRIHNANTHFDPVNNISLRFTPYFLFKDLSHFIRRLIIAREIKYRNKLLASVDYISLPDSGIENYCQKKGFLEDYKVLPTLPFCYNQIDSQKNSSNDLVKIVIPGTVDNRRKDYNLVFEAFRKSLDKLEKTVKLVLLGRPKGPYGRKVLSQFKKLTSEKFTVKTYENKVPEAEFIAQMSKADFLLLPLITITRYHFYKEEYGVTKMSGGINDIVRFGQAALISQYPLPSDLKVVTQEFSDEKSLIDSLTDWINNGSYLKLDRSGLENYSLKNQQDRLVSSLNSILK